MRRAALGGQYGLKYGLFFKAAVRFAFARLVLQPSGPTNHQKSMVRHRVQKRPARPTAAARAPPSRGWEALEQRGEQLDVDDGR